MLFFVHIPCAVCVFVCSYTSNRLIAWYHAVLPWQMNGQQQNKRLLSDKHIPCYMILAEHYFNTLTLALADTNACSCI